MNSTQMRWAAAHDWYAGASLKNNEYIVTVYDDMVAGLTINFTNFESLYLWAGY